MRKPEGKCARCRHLKKWHWRATTIQGCAAYYSAGPSGSFQCQCSGFRKEKGKGEKAKAAESPRRPR